MKQPRAGSKFSTPTSQAKAVFLGPAVVTKFVCAKDGSDSLPQIVVCILHVSEQKH